MGITKDILWKHCDCNLLQMKIVRKSVNLLNSVCWDMCIWWRLLNVILKVHQICFFLQKLSSLFNFLNQIWQDYIYWCFFCWIDSLTLETNVTSLLSFSLLNVGSQIVILISRTMHSILNTVIGYSQETRFTKCNPSSLSHDSKNLYSVIHICLVYWI